MKETVLGYSSGGVGVLISAVQTNEWLGVILAILSIIEVLITTAYMIYKWYKNAKSDNSDGGKKITKKEIEDAIDIVKEGIDDITDIVEKENKDGID